MCDTIYRDIYIQWLTCSSGFWSREKFN